MTGFHHGIFIWRLLLWENIFLAACRLLHKETEIRSCQLSTSPSTFFVLHTPAVHVGEHCRITERLTDSQLPKHRHKKQGTQVVGKKKNTWTYLPTRAIGVCKTKKDGDLHIGKFQSFWKWKIFFLWKKNTIKVPRCCLSRHAIAVVASGSDSHPQKLVFYLKMAFLSLSPVCHFWKSPK